MSYHLASKASVGDGVRRIVLEEIGLAIANLDEHDTYPEKSIHEVRKHCKKIRGALRLVRCSFNDYRNENARFRDLARKLSPLRDARALHDTHRYFVEHAPGRGAQPGVSTLNEALESYTAPILANSVEELDSVRAGLAAAREDVDKWSMAGTGFDAIAGGLQVTYRRARKRLPRSQEKVDDDRLHDWRKRVKYHWYHMRLLANAWPRIIKAHAGAADHLSGLLGDDHDIATYLSFLDGINDTSLAGTAQAVQQCADERRAALQEESLTVGTRLFAEKPKRFVERLAAYWNVGGVSLT
jgi:CHAD domain-containing protein